MPIIATEDYPNKRIYLSIDTVGVALSPIDLYKEHRARRRTNANGERKFLPMVSAFGNEAISSTKSTPRFTNLASGVKIVPYDTSQNLLVTGALISTEDELEGRDLFDRSSLLSNVDIDYQPPQVEIIKVTENSGSGLSSDQNSWLFTLYNLTTAGTGLTQLSANSFSNLPVQTVNLSTTSLNAIDSLISGIESNVGLLLDYQGLTVGKSVVFSETSTVVGSNEVVISLVTDEINNIVTKTRTS